MTERTGSALESGHARMPGGARGAIPLIVTMGWIALTACAGEQEIERPAPLYRNIPIEYPLALWDADVEGETLVRVKVNDTGGVDSVEVVESSGYEAFDSAAIVGAKQLRFSPARRNGKRIDVWARVPVLFTKRPGGERPQAPHPQESSTQPADSPA